MSKKNVYSVYDSVSEEFGLPVLFKNDVQAYRSFKKEVLENDKVAFPSDYKLFRIGEFDDETGEIDGYFHVEVSHSLDYHGQLELAYADSDDLEDDK